MEIQSQRNSMSDAERWASVAGGFAALYWGIRRGGLVGSAVAVTGGNFAIMGLTGERNLLRSLGVRLPGDQSLPYGQGIKVRRSVTINRPAEELYRFWRNLENLPRFMSHLESVQVLDATHSHWTAVTPGGKKVEWHAEITAEREDEMIGWRAASSWVDHAGSVRFERAPGGRGTVVRVQIQYNLTGGRLTAGIAKLLGAEPEQLIRQDLTRLKQLMETGEIPTTDGQPSGRDQDRRRVNEVRAENERRATTLERVTEASEASFPASDSPSWTLSGGGGA